MASGGHRSAFTRHAARAAILLAGVGAISRLTFRNFETRWQIVILWGVVLVYQLVLRPAFGKRISPASTILDVVCVAVAIVAVKVAIEGQL